MFEECREALGYPVLLWLQGWWQQEGPVGHSTKAPAADAQHWVTCLPAAGSA
jgi:hypothetical protein